MLRRLVRNLGTRVGDGDLPDLRQMVALQRELNDAIVAAIRGLRTQGVTWDELGEATGTSRQAAWQKWYRPEDQKLERAPWLSRTVEPWQTTAARHRRVLAGGPQ